MRLATYTVNAQGQYLSGGFQNASGVLTNPTTVTLKVRDGAGATSTPTPVNDSAGLYHFDEDTTGKPGIWTSEWIGTGAVQAIAVYQFRVTPAPL